MEWPQRFASDRSYSVLPAVPAVPAVPAFVIDALDAAS